jgi:hypothetical protein
MLADDKKSYGPLKPWQQANSYTAPAFKSRVGIYITNCRENLKSIIEHLLRRLHLAHVLSVNKRKRNKGRVLGVQVLTTVSNEDYSLLGYRDYVHGATSQKALIFRAIVASTS